MQSSYETEGPRPELSPRNTRPSPGPSSSELPSSESGINSLLARGPRGALRQFGFWTGVNQIRELWDWGRTKHLVLPTVAELAASLAALDDSPSQLNSHADGFDSPIFLLANGWRTGSTLLQRILVTDQRLLLWGEPFGEMAFISSLAESLTRLSTFPNLKQRFATDDLISSAETAASMAKSWIATLFPAGDALRSSLRGLLSGWFQTPAVDRGFSRWGFKEVRLGATEATLLHWLYPNAKFVILSRHPFDCYRSLADSGWHHVYYRRPDIRVDSAASFARHWNRVALSWSDLPAGFPAVHIRYEDMVQGKVDFRQLESWLGIEINEAAALRAPVGRTAVRSRLSWLERFIITNEAETGMRTLGYSR